MPYEPFYERFRDLAFKETRTMTLFENNPYGLPPDDYGLVELFCNDEGCDCRRVFFNIFSMKRGDFVAVITYGWESEEFYYKWLGDSDSQYARMAVKEMTGPSLNPASEQSELAPALLRAVSNVLKDDAYVARIKRHYQFFKENTDPKHFKPVGKSQPADSPLNEPSASSMAEWKEKKARKRHRRAGN